MKTPRWYSPWRWLEVIAIAGLVTGCATTAQRVVFKEEGIVVTQTAPTDPALKTSGPGGTLAVINTAVVYGKEYPALVGDAPCFVESDHHTFLLFVCAIPNRNGGYFPDRELHLINRQDKGDTVIFLGASTMGDDFGSHLPGTKFAPKVSFESDQQLRITTFDGRTAFAPVHQPNRKVVFVVSLSQKKLISETKTRIPDFEKK